MRKAANHLHLPCYNHFWNNIVRKAAALVCIIIFPLLLVHSQSIPDYARAGLKLWAFSALPILLPFIILSKFWIYYGIPELMLTLSGKFIPNKAIAATLPVLLLGLCSGFPVGAIYVRHFYESHTFSREAAENMLPLCSFVSPMFLMGYVRSLDHSPKKEWCILMICLYAPVILLYIIKIFQNIFPVSEYGFGISYRNDGNIQSVRGIWLSSLEIIFTIGIYMMLFSILFGLSKNSSILELLPFRILMSNLEITTGCQYIVNTAFHSKLLKNMILLAALEFGGLCTLAQIRSVMDGTDLSIKCYIKTKAVAAIISVVMYIVLQQ